MNAYKLIAKPLLWFMAIVLVALTAGCGGGSDPVLGGGGAGSSTSAKAITTYSLAGVAGTINEAANTIAVTVPSGTSVTTLVATFTTTGASVQVGTTVQVSAVTTNNFTTAVNYTVTAADGTSTVYTVTVTVASVTAKAMTSFSFAGYAGAVGTINEAAKTIVVTVPSGTTLTALVATFTSTGVSVKIGAAVQTSAATANNFTGPVVYRVTAGDASTADYTVTVTVASAASKAITAYSFVGYTGAAGTINEVAKTIAVTVPFGTDVTTLVATFTTTGASVKVGTTAQTSAATANNFTSTVAYTVTAADATTAVYTVTVTVASNAAKAMTSFSFAGYTGAAGTINEAAKTIAVTVPNGTNVTALVATFVSTGVSVKVGTAVQTSTATANNFTSPVVYRVTAGNASTADYTVTVTVAGTGAKAITAYSLLGVTGTINEPAKTIGVVVPTGTNVTALIATFTTTGTNVHVGAAVQTSTATANDFTAPVVYRVTAGDLTTVDYTVTVTFVANPTAPTLGEAGRFVILANQAITTTGVTAISNGDIGITPAARSFITGFTTSGPAGDYAELTGDTWPGMLSTSYAPADANPAPFPYPLHYALPHAVWTTTGAMLTQAHTDQGIANTFLNADPNPTAATQSCPAELGTLTLTRGVYKAASNVGITTGSLTLDAQGDPNAVFIFVIGGTLTTAGASSGSIVLANGAQAKNVFWTTGGTTVIGAGSIFYGSVFAWTQINVLAGAQITGSLFGITDRVTLIADTVTKAP